MYNRKEAMRPLRSTLFLLLLSFFFRFGIEEASGQSNPCYRDQIVGLGNGERTPVYAAPNRGHLKVGDLGPGDIVFSCGETFEWINVLFRSNEALCGSETERSKAVGDEVPPEALSTCKSAWIERQFVAYLGKSPDLPEQSYRCNLAQIVPLKDGDIARVYAAPSIGYLRIGTLKTGDIAYVCNGGGEWLNIYFSAPGGACSKRSTLPNGLPDDLPVEIAVTCNAGWIERKYVEILSG